MCELHKFIYLFIFPPQKSSLESDVKNLNSRLDEEKTQTENLQSQITKAKGKLQEDMLRARSTLLTDIISMQLFYALRDLPLDFGHHLSENDISLKDICAQWAATKCKILENTDLLLDLLKCYLNEMNSKGEKMLEDGGSLNCSVGCEELLNADKRLLSASEEVSLYMTNKTDDDKVVASTGFCETLPYSETSTESSILSTEQNFGDGEESSNIRDKLVSLKKFMDDKALGFLTKVFELDVGNESTPLNTRQDIYGRIQELLKQEGKLLGGYLKMFSHFFSLVLINFFSGLNILTKHFTMSANGRELVVRCTPNAIFSAKSILSYTVV